MALMIYQVGDLKLWDVLSSKADDSIQVKSERSWKLSTDDFSGVSGVHVYNDPANPLAENPKYDITGSIFCDAKSAEMTFAHLKSIGGIYMTPLIGFRYEECDHVEEGQCCSQCNKTLDWIVTYGMITKVGDTSSYLDSSKPWTVQEIPISFTFEANTKWKALIPWEWEYRRSNRILNPASPNNRRESASNLFVIPSSLASLSPNGYFYKWGTVLSKYNPTYWGEKYTNNRRGGYGSDYTVLGQYDFNSDPRIWSAAPNSVYAFTTFSDTNGIITISVTVNYGFFQNENRTELSTLDLSEVHADLIAVGRGGLQQNDVIITGYANPFPGLILRDNEIVPDIRPRWSYNGYYPGQTGRGYNSVQFSASEVSCQVAFVHDFGAY